MERYSGCAPAQTPGKNPGVSPVVGLTRSSAVCADLVPRDLLDLPQRSGCSLAQRHFPPGSLRLWRRRRCSGGASAQPLQLRRVLTWLCSAGKSAQVAALSPGGGGTQTGSPLTASRHGSARSSGGLRGATAVPGAAHKPRWRK